MCVFVMFTTVIVESTGEDGRSHSSHITMHWLDQRAVLSNLVLAIHQQDQTAGESSSAQLYVNCQLVGTLPLAQSPSQMKSAGFGSSSSPSTLRVVIHYCSLLSSTFSSSCPL